MLYLKDCCGVQLYTLFASGVAPAIFAPAITFATISAVLIAADPRFAVLCCVVPCAICCCFCVPSFPFIHPSSK